MYKSIVKIKATMNHKQSEKNDFYIYGSDDYNITKGWDRFSY